jgi:hypothetical protein
MESILKKRNILLVLFSLILLTVRCKKDNQDVTVTMNVAAKTVKATVGWTNGVTDNLNVKEEGSNEGWRPMYIGQIEGFSYEEGYEYVLKVKKYPIKNPPQDGSSMGFTLIEIVSKKKV